jgi:hypothetical protein
MKTSELTGAALDWAVAQCEYFPVRNGFDDNCPEYSTNWAQGGPIIERERINVDPSPDSPEWYGYYDNHGKWHSNSTPLIAAMRCYVANKLGDEVEIPDELHP